MDALSIVVASVGLVSVCGKLSGHISWITSKVPNVDKSLESLNAEVGVYSGVLESIGGSFCDPSLARLAFAPQTGHEEEHWRDVKEAIEECKRLLEDLHQNLQPTRSPVRGAKWMIVDVNAEAIRLHLHHITAYRRTLEVSRHIIELYNPPINFR
jgi:hypothetical protein